MPYIEPTSERGATSVEVAILVALVAIVSVGSLQALGKNINRSICGDAGTRPGLMITQDNITSGMYLTSGANKGRCFNYRSAFTPNSPTFFW